jgi:hypothetical protein
MTNIISHNDHSFIHLHNEHRIHTPPYDFLAYDYDTTRKIQVT